MLTLDNGATLNTNRLPDNATLKFAGGAMSLQGRNAVGVATTETVGTIHLAQGQSFIRSLTGAGGTSTFTAGNLVRAPGATVDFTGPGLGTATNRFLFTAAPTTVGNNGGILPTPP